MVRTVFALGTALALAGCGGLESPDLGTGTLRGRIVGGRAGGYVYPLGLPGAKVPIDAEGRFEIEELPVGDVALVVVDGVDPIDGTRRAGIVQAEVEGAEEHEIEELDAADLPLAGRVFAMARPAGGAVAADPRFTVIGTDQIDAGPGATGLALLDPLPPGDFELVASMSGFVEVRTALTVVSATVIVEVPLDVDPASPAPGCAATGECVNGLACDLPSGTCVECLGAAECEAKHGIGATCVGGSCEAGGSTSGLLCAGCTDDTQCASGVCAFDGTSGFCSAACTIDWNCHAGFACGLVNGRSVCVPPAGCAAFREGFGAPCFDDAACGGAVAGGSCEGEDPAAVPPQPGFCTGECIRATAGACAAVGGFTCNAGMATAGICVRG